MGAQYLHNNRTELYRWAVENNMIDKRPVNTDDDNVFTGRTKDDLPKAIDKLLWQYSEAEEADINKLMIKYPQAGDSIGW
jgi:hypothetical protein